MFYKKGEIHLIGTPDTAATAAASSSTTTNENANANTSENKNENKNTNSGRMLFRNDEDFAGIDFSIKKYF